MDLTQCISTCEESVIGLGKLVTQLKDDLKQEGIATALNDYVTKVCDSHHHAQISIQVIRKQNNPLNIVDFLCS